MNDFIREIRTIGFNQQLYSTIFLKIVNTPNGQCYVDDSNGLYIKCDNLLKKIIIWSFIHKS